MIPIFPPGDALIRTIQRAISTFKRCDCERHKMRREVFAQLRAERREALVKRWMPWK